MFITGMRLKPKCPRCHSFMYLENDGNEDYFLCANCAREFDLNLEGRRILADDFVKRIGIALPKEQVNAVLQRCLQTTEN